MQKCVCVCIIKLKTHARSENNFVIILFFFASYETAGIAKKRRRMGCFSHRINTHIDRYLFTCVRKKTMKVNIHRTKRKKTKKDNKDFEKHKQNERRIMQ